MNINYLTFCVSVIHTAAAVVIENMKMITRDDETHGFAFFSFVLVAKRTKTPNKTNSRILFFHIYADADRKYGAQKQHHQEEQHQEQQQQHRQHSQ